MKLSTADRMFSLCVRERSEWTCEKCGTYYQPPTKALQCSHYFSRVHKGTRWDKDNAFAHCAACHTYLGGNSEVFKEWATAQLGQGLIDILREKHLDTNLGKLMKKSEKEIAAHYRKQHERMQQQRAAGITGRIEFEGWA